jgi:co-chaperonin GroES (HSP10)
MKDTFDPSIKAAPGIYLIELLEDETAVNLGKTKEKQILKGRILDVGENRTHDQGGELKATFKNGDTVWFYSYVNGADFFVEKRIKYFTVIFNDCRAYIAKDE